MKFLYLFIFFTCAFLNVQSQCWTFVAANYYDRTYAIKDDSTLWGWGNNTNGILGDGSTDNKNFPVKIGTASNFVFVAAGLVHTLALKADGTIWGWGAYDRQLGTGGNILQPQPIQITPDNDWKAVSAGWHHSLALKQDGSLWAWGTNSDGQLGIGPLNPKDPPQLTDAPLRVGTGNDWKCISASTSTSFAIKNNGTLWAWGYNYNGLLGVTEGYAVTFPMQVGTDTDWKFVSSGVNHTCAIKTNGSLWGWGSNENHGAQNGNIIQLVGDGSGKNQFIPVQIGHDTDWQFVSAGGLNSLAKKTNGSLWAWGSNIYGQIGDGTDTSTRNTPVQINAAVTDFACGGDHVAAIRNDTLWVWGRNDFGAIGDRSYKNRNVPTYIACCDNTWTGAVNSLWEEAGNWSCNVVPGANTDVIINSGVVILNSNAVIRSLYLNPNASLTIGENYTLTVLR